MIVGEIINPSDHCEIDCTDWEAACFAVTLLGKGRYALKTETREMPLFMFGGCDAWWLDTFGESFGDGLTAEKYPRIVKALESVTLGGKERSSLNDICGYAKDWAKALKAKIQEVAKS